MKTGKRLAVIAMIAVMITSMTACSDSAKKISETTVETNDNSTVVTVNGDYDYELPSSIENPIKDTDHVFTFKEIKDTGYVKDFDIQIVSAKKTMTYSYDYNGYAEVTFRLTNRLDNGLTGLYNPRAYQNGKRCNKMTSRNKAYREVSENVLEYTKGYELETADDPLIISFEFNDGPSCMPGIGFVEVDFSRYL